MCPIVWLVARLCGDNSAGVQELTFARSDVVQVQLVALLGSLQGALGGKEVARRVVGLVVSAADLETRTKTVWSEGSQMCSFQFPFKGSELTCSNSPSAAGQEEGSWHTHMGVLLSSTSHTLPFLQ